MYFRNRLASADIGLLLSALVLSGCGAGGGESQYSTPAQDAATVDSQALLDAATGDGQLDPDGSCATTSLQAERVPLDMFFMVDTSGSMEGPKLSALKTGLKEFFQAASSADLGAAAQQFPLGGFTESCDPAHYASPASPWASLPNPSLPTWIDALQADGYTPSFPALRGAVDACQLRTGANPGRKCAVVFVTDGEPEGNCDPVSSSALAPLGVVAAEAWSNGIAVFAIGFPGLSAVGQQILITVAQKGGTQIPFAIKEGNLDTDFGEALDEIRGSALGCEYQMPQADDGTVNPDLVLVTYTPGGGSAPVTVPRRIDETACGGDGGWAYDDNEQPTKLVMCPATCDTMRKDGSGKVDIMLGCTPNLY